MRNCYINASSAIHPNGIVGENNILRAIEPDYKDIITNANQRRRMSHVIRMGVACGLDCLKNGGDIDVDAIITATGLGCLADTEKFLKTMIEMDERLLNPTPFIQSTFNTIGAQIALIKGNHSYNNTYVHRGLSFESALIDSMMRIWEGDDNVLVGAVDEATDTSHILLQRLGLLKDITLGEGSQFFILSSSKTDDSYAELKGVKTLTGAFSQSEIENKIHLFLEVHNLQASDIHILFSGKNGHKTQDFVYSEIEKNLFPKASHSTFKDICGEYQTASSFGLWKAANRMKDRRDGNTLIYNHHNNINHSLILLSKC